MYREGKREIQQGLLQYPLPKKQQWNGDILIPNKRDKMQPFITLTGGFFLGVGLYILNWPASLELENGDKFLTVIGFIAFGYLHFQSKRRSNKHKRTMEKLSEEMQREKLEEQKWRTAIAKKSFFDDDEDDEEKVLGIGS